MPGSDEPITDETGAEVDPYDQLDASDTLDQSGVTDPLDTGYSPPERFRTLDDGEDETIEDRIRQEEPDPDSAYGAPDNESGLDRARLGGDDPDAIDAEDDWLGDGEVGGRRAGRLVAPDEGRHEDDEDELVGEDVGIDGAAASAEEAAVHVVDNDSGEDWS